MTSTVVTQEMLDAGYAAAENIASQYGYGWMFRQFPQNAAMFQLAAVFKAMAAHAPKDATPPPHVANVSPPLGAENQGPESANSPN